MVQSRPTFADHDQAIAFLQDDKAKWAKTLAQHKKASKAGK